MRSIKDILAGICQTFAFYNDGTETLATCDTCNERHYFRSEYFARQWANAHAVKRSARTFCICENH